MHEKNAVLGFDPTELTFTVSRVCSDREGGIEFMDCDSGTCVGIAAVGSEVCIGDVEGGKLRDDYPYQPVFKVGRSDLDVLFAGFRRGEFVR